MKLKLKNLFVTWVTSKLEYELGIKYLVLRGRAREGLLVCVLFLFYGI